ncbi:rRNA (cytosine-C5-)-methyltransferase nop2 [Bachmanniomyces sp. S44760]|nr:rRNA (cytosine-C5-)-methyltransferase nop2 [Bachmanniomyces sp. S44760]
MGVGRRMQKQGPPAPLEDFQRPALTKSSSRNRGDRTRGKKRAATGEVVDHSASKRLRSDNRSPGGKHTTRGNLANAQSTQAKIGKSVASKSKSGATENVLLRSSDDDNIANLLGSEFDHDSVAIDEAKEGSDSSLTPAQDEFLDSGSSVFDSDPDHEKAMFSEDDGEDAEEKLTAANIEGLSRRLDAAQEAEAEDAQLELDDAAIQTNIDGDRVKVLADAEDDEEGATAASRLAPDLQLLRTRISDTVRILGDFAKLAEHGRSRADYTTQLLKDICAYYGYSPYLADKLFNLFPPREAFAFFESNETPRPVVIRTNTLRTHRRDLAQSLINRGVTLEPVGKWSKVGLQVFESQVPLGATPEYLAGQYILQAASSFLPVMALAPQEHERILDMAAAPGGKTTYISALMKNTGCIFANDSNKSRAKGLIGNIHRLGCKNTIVCNHDARDFPKVIGGFDRVLLDAPCSGTGVIAKDPSVKTNKTEKDFMLLPHLQKQILLSAIDSVDHASKTGGYLVYSTCSVTVEENESVVQYALNKRPNVKLVETGLPFGAEGFVNYMGKKFDPRMKMARRFYPHKYNVDGFFVSKFKKLGPSLSGAVGAKNGVNGGLNGSLDEHTNGMRDGDEVEDKTPIGEEDDFTDFDQDGDDAIIERALRRGLKRKGIDPRAMKHVDKVKLNGKADA